MGQENQNAQIETNIINNLETEINNNFNKEQKSKNKNIVIIITLLLIIVVIIMLFTYLTRRTVGGYLQNNTNCQLATRCNCNGVSDGELAECEYKDVQGVEGKARCTINQNSRWLCDK